MKRSYTILPPHRPPWRYDLYQALFAALSLPASLHRGEARARELYRQAQMIAEKTGEELSSVVWALATFEHAITHSTAEEETFQSFPSSHSSPQRKPSRQAALFVPNSSKRPNPSPQSSHCSEPLLWG